MSNVRVIIKISLIFKRRPFCWRESPVLRIFFTQLYYLYTTFFNYRKKTLKNLIKLQCVMNITFKKHILKPPVFLIISLQYLNKSGLLH